MKKPKIFSIFSRYELATDYNLWSEYIVPAAIISKKKFSAMTVAEKIKIMEDLFELKGPDKKAETK